MGARSTGNHPTTTKADGHLLEYFRQTFGAGGGGTNYVAPPPGGITATGGVISDYTDPGPGNVYRSHIFTTTGTFDVTETPGSYGDDVEFLVVGGGGGGGFGNNAGGGGGSGGLRTNLTGHPLAPNESTFPISTSPGSYTVTVGGGGVGSGPTGQGTSGTPSVFGPGPVTSQGGGGGGGPASAGTSGGSGGGGGTSPGGGPYAGGTGNRVTGTGTPAPTQGNPGGTGQHVAGIWEGGGGGGGAGGSGGNAAPGPGQASYGGAGVQVAIAGPAADTTGVGGPNPATGEYQWFAGGGGGAPRGVGGAGSALAVGTAPRSGAGSGAPGSAGTIAGYGVAGTGSGGGGNGWGSGAISGHGGSGIVVVRYQIGSVQTGDAKATGGSVSFYTAPADSPLGAGQKTIHTFTTTGTFETPGTFSETCGYVVVGGGGGAFTGGGGAGGYRTGTTPIGPNVNYAITIGAGGNAKSPIASPSSIGTIPIAIPGGGSPTGPAGAPQPGASGGGGTQGGSGSTGASATGSPYPGTIGATPASGWGHPGGNGQPADKTGGGGGGAGGAGDPGSQGGTGIQLPTTFRDPNGFQYDNHPDHPFRPSATAGWFVAGGGAGTVYTPFPQASPPLGPTPYSATYPGMGGVGGGGCRNPADPRFSVYGINGMANTGGGAAGGTTSSPKGGAQGGSGLVLIAYPT